MGTFLMYLSDVEAGGETGEMGQNSPLQEHTRPVLHTSSNFLLMAF